MHRLMLLAMIFATGCRNKDAANDRTDMGPCITIVREGREYWLCEKTSSGQSAATNKATGVEAVSNEAQAAKVKAEQLADEAIRDAKAAQEALDQLQKEAGAFATRVDAAIDAITAAQSQADRDEAKAKLEQLRREKHDLDARIADAKAKAARAQRMKGVKVSNECLDNPLADGCN